MMASHSFLSKFLRAGVIWLISGMFLLSQPVFAIQLNSSYVSVSYSPGDIGWKPGFSLNGVDGAPEAIAVDGKNVYVAGSFSVAGNAIVNGIAMWDGSAWHPLAKEFFNSYSALAVDGRGHLYASGKFNQDNVNYKTSIARWNGQEWEPLGDFDFHSGIVNALAVDSSGNVYAGGQFSSINGIEASGIAMWDGLQWHSLKGGVTGLIPNGIVNAITINKFGFVYAGGSFTSAGGKPANNIARWDGSEWYALGEGIVAGDTSTGVFALVADSRGNLYAGGTFTKAGGSEAFNVARWNGDSWSTLGGGVTGVMSGFRVVQSILIDGGIVYIAGAFKSVGNIPVKGIARWTGTAWENVNDGEWAGLYLPTGEPFVYLTGLAMDRDGLLFAIGWFREAGGRSASNIAVWDGTTWSGLGAERSVEAGISGMVSDKKGGIYIAGGFLSAGGIIVNGVAHWDGSTWTGLAGGLTGNFSYGKALALDNQGNLYVGGYFTLAGNVPANNIAKWNGTGWESLGSGVVGDVSAMAVDSQGHLYVSGWIYTAGDVPVDNIAEWTGTQWVAMGSGLHGMPAYALVIDSQDRLIAGGNFDAAAGVQVYGLARWDGQTWESISGGVQRRITSLFLKGDTLYLASDRVWKLQDGIFEQVGEPFSYRLSNGSIMAMAFDNQGRLVVGGGFDKAGEVVANNIGRWNGSNWENLGSGTNHWIRSLVVDDGGNLLVAGGFSQAGGKVSMCFAQWNDPFYQWMPFIAK